MKHLTLVGTRLGCLTLLTAGLASAAQPTRPAVLQAPVPLFNDTAPAQKEAPPVPRPAVAAPFSPVFPSSALYPIDLPTSLRLADASNPAVAMARLRVEQAYQRQAQADVLWLPSLIAGPGYTRHDGLTQNQAGVMLYSNRWSLAAGGGAVLRTDTSDALFGPLIARRLTSAQQAHAQSTANNIGFDAANAYFDLLDAHARLAINADTLANAEEMLKNARAAEKAGVGKTPADAPRAEVEVRLRRTERQRLQAHAAQVSARLGQLLLLDPTVDLVPAEAMVVPLTLIPLQGGIEPLIATGLANRPEVAESRALAEAASTRWRQAQWDPLLPKLEISYAGNHFEGGVRDDTDKSSGRGDGAAGIYWELRNLGAGNLAKVRERRALSEEATYLVQEVQARVAAEIAAAAKTAMTLERSLDDAKAAVSDALQTWQRLKDASFGIAGPDRRYDPLEPLIAVQQLDASRIRYLETIIGYNKSQFRLLQSIGNSPLSTVSQDNCR